MSWPATRTTQRLPAGTVPVPQWPAGARSSAVRVLVEHPEPAARDLLATGLRDRGYEVVGCGGPNAHGDQRTVSCPVLEGYGCPAVDGADVIVSSLHLERDMDGMIVRQIAQDPVSPPILVEATDWHVERAFGSSDAVPHQYPFSTVAGVATAIEGVLAR